MSVPVRDGKRSLGETVITILPGDKVTVSKSALLEMLAPVLSERMLGLLQWFDEKDGRIDIADLRSSGIELAFDSEQF